MSLVLKLKLITVLFTLQLRTKMKKEKYGGINNKIWQSRSIVYNPEKVVEFIFNIENAFSGENKKSIKIIYNKANILKK